MALTAYDWIKEKLIDSRMDKSEVYDAYEDYIAEFPGGMEKDSYKRKVRNAFFDLTESADAEDFDEEDMLKIEARKQGLMDTNNLLRKSGRESYRLWLSLEETFKTYIEALKTVNLSKVNIKEHKDEKAERYGIAQISDNHFNEWIEKTESHGNEYNFHIASQRLKKYVSETTKIFKMYGIKTIYLFFTGDAINSDRRLSEKYAAITSQVRAALLATYIYQQVIIEFSQNFNVNVAYCVGNESRIGEVDMDSSDVLSSNNWDYSIMLNLRQIFKDKKVNFIKPDNNIQSVVRLPNGFNALILHGHTLKTANSVEKSIATNLQNYLYKGIPIHGVFSGHFHSSSVGEIISRSSSLCGGNAYSSNDLGFFSRASQNCYVVNTDLGYHGIKIDLQNASNFKGYDIIEELEHYNVQPKNGYNVEVVVRNLT